MNLHIFVKTVGLKKKDAIMHLTWKDVSKERLLEAEVHRSYPSSVHKEEKDGSQCSLIPHCDCQSPLMRRMCIDSFLLSLLSVFYPFDSKENQDNDHTATNQQYEIIMPSTGDGCTYREPSHHRTQSCPYSSHPR